MLSMLLRIAESLDRSHADLAQQARLDVTGRKTARLTIACTQDCSLEVNGLKPHLEAFEDVFGKRLEIKQAEA